MPLSRTEADRLLAAFRAALDHVTEGASDRSRAPDHAAPARRATEPGAIASDADLDSQYGDEEIRRGPSEKYWQGRDFTGCRMSELTAEELLAYARYKDAGATANAREGKPDRAKYIAYDRRSAARARGWAKRLEAQQASSGSRSSTPTWSPPPAGVDDDIPF
jgi:hypothetical protein